MTTPAKLPRFQSHTFKQECQIADGPQPFAKPVVGYEFNGGKRKFDDKVSKTKRYD
ncbi:MAG: hypothetical protein PHT88_04710 [Candidatus Moranbacteria bacterium]|nr:hypothetical protein [Candidatus Moranbacteria bacterium]